jgi:hypothetical protein
MPFHPSRNITCHQPITNALCSVFYLRVSIAPKYNLQADIGNSMRKHGKRAFQTQVAFLHLSGLKSQYECPILVVEPFGARNSTIFCGS